MNKAEDQSTDSGDNSDKPENKTKSSDSKDEAGTASILGFVSFLAISIYIFIVAYFDFFNLPLNPEIVTASRFWFRIFVREAPWVPAIAVILAGLIYWVKKPSRDSWIYRWKINFINYKAVYYTLAIVVFALAVLLGHITFDETDTIYKNSLVLFFIAMIFLPSLIGSYELENLSFKEHAVNIFTYLLLCVVLYLISSPITSQLKYNPVDGRIMVWEAEEKQYFVNCQSKMGPMLETKGWGYEKCTDADKEKDNYQSCKDSSYKHIRPLSGDVASICKRINKQTNAGNSSGVDSGQQ